MLAGRPDWPGARQFLDTAFPEDLWRRFLAINVKHRHLGEYLGKEIQRLGDRNGCRILLELGIAMPAELLSAPQCNVELLANVRRASIRDEQMAVRGEGGFPVAGLLGGRRRWYGAGRESACPSSLP